MKLEIQMSREWRVFLGVPKGALCPGSGGGVSTFVGLCGDNISFLVPCARLSPD